MMPSQAQIAGTPPINAAVALLLGGYLIIAIWQGNLGALAAQAKADFLGGATTAKGGSSQNTTGFWRWAMALLILIWIADLPSVRPYAGGLIGFVLVAMLIELETTQAGTFQKLNQSIASLFGRSTTSTGITGK